MDATEPPEESTSRLKQFGRRLARLAASAAQELLGPEPSVSRKSMKFVVLLQAVVIAGLIAFLLVIQGELAHLRHTAQAPLEKGSSKEMVDLLCQDSSLAKQLHDKFGNVVLIINTNYEDVARSTGGFLRTVYGRFFENIVIISEKDIPELKVQARGQHLWTAQWYYCFWHLPKVIAQYPDADAYLWTNDDVAMNYWQLLGGNISKIWLTNAPGHPEAKYFPFDKTVEAQWTDWAGTNETRESALKAYSTMDEVYRRQFDKSVEPNAGTFPKRICDLYLVPRRFAKALSLDLIPIFRDFKIWSEVAIPIMFFALDHPRNWDHVLDNMKYSWGHWEQSKAFDPATHWSPNISAFHPWKLSHEDARRRFIMAFSAADPCILSLLESNVSFVDHSERRAP